MNLAHDLIIDPPPSAGDRDKPLATWYTQGHSDGLGDRLLMFDNTSAPSWEILRFNPAIARVPEFEEALRERVECLRSFHHPAFPVVRAIEELGREDGLAVASTYATGVRLSDALKKPRSAPFTIRLIRQLAPARRPRALPGRNATTARRPTDGGFQAPSQPCARESSAALHR